LTQTNFGFYIRVGSFKQKVQINRNKIYIIYLSVVV